MKKCLPLLIFFLITENCTSQDGTFDSTFGTNGIVQYTTGGGGLAVIPGGKFYRYGQTSTSTTLSVIRNNANGSIDSSFGNNGISSIDYSSNAYKVEPQSLLAQPDGKIIIASTISHYASFPNADQKNLLVRLHLNGSVDISREFGFRELCQPSSIALQPDGKLLVSGVSSYSGSYVPPQTTGGYAYASRFTNNGSPDNTFGNSGTFELYENLSNCRVCKFAQIAVQSSGKIITVVWNGDMMRLFNNGTFDSSFGTGGTAKLDYGQKYDMVVQPDGKILVTGFGFAVQRFTENGIPDSTFGINGTVPNTFPLYGPYYPSAQVFDIDLQADGKILMAGHYDSINSSPKIRRLICRRLNADGSIDSSFANHGTFTHPDYTDDSQAYAIQHFNDKILVGVGRGNNPTYFRLKNPSQSFPLHLLTFTATLKDKITHLQWTSENEQNFSQYEVERSTNSKEWSKVGSAKSKGGSGKNEYSYDDDLSRLTSHGSRLYYRLKMVDKDGSFTYSNIANIRLNSHSAFSIYPNPATTSLQLQFDKKMNEKVEVQVVNVNGKTVVSRQLLVVNGLCTLSISKLAVGSYVIKVKVGNEVYNDQFIIGK